MSIHHLLDHDLIPISVLHHLLPPHDLVPTLIGDDFLSDVVAILILRYLLRYDGFFAVLPDDLLLDSLDAVLVLANNDLLDADLLLAVDVDVFFLFFKDLLALLPLHNPDLLALLILKPHTLLHLLPILGRGFGRQLDLSTTDGEPSIRFHEVIHGLGHLDLGGRFLTPTEDLTTGVDYDLLLDLDLNLDHFATGVGALYYLLHLLRNDLITLSEVVFIKLRIVARYATHLRRLHLILILDVTLYGVEVLPAHEVLHHGVLVERLVELHEIAHFVHVEAATEIRMKKTFRLL
jgi:hypothetical protein